MYIRTCGSILALSECHGKEVDVLQREIAEEVEEEREQYLSELPEREAV